MQHIIFQIESILRGTYMYLGVYIFASTLYLTYHCRSNSNALELGFLNNGEHVVLCVFI